MILVNEMDEKGKISKLHIGTYDKETAQEIYDIKKRDGWQVYMELEVKFLINRMKENLEKLNNYKFI